MPSTPVRDLTLLLDAADEEDGQWRYTASLFEGWPEGEQRLAEHDLANSFYQTVIQASQQPSDEACGRVLFDWVFPPYSQLREAFLRRCEAIGQEGAALRLWISSRLTRVPMEYLTLEREAKVSWEGFWVQEWADEANRPTCVQSPFLALTPWIHLLRRPPGVSVPRRFTVPGKLNILIVLSNPPPPGSEKWGHIKYLERDDGSGMFLRVYRAFHQHRGVGWVYRLRNPTKVSIARCIREYQPHVVTYLGHGYSDQYSSGLVLAVTENGNDFREVPGVRQCSYEESELEQVPAGNSFDTLISPMGLITCYPVVDCRPGNPVLSRKGFDFGTLFPQRQYIFDGFRLAFLAQFP